jgi:hypothetical protein
LTIIIPRDSGPKACSRVEKEMFPGQVISLATYACVGSRSPFFKSSKVTVTAAEAILVSKASVFKGIYER